ncbi:hypothetical protein CC1G_12297 [Coprinopsis cinerea okayama7|uniref:Uncharacterized protein n=1 Tax=Coprinopsis cinerea (strain Okayama-7 / 130 / ATCC MYA-4618 / FGSC 9003) TaxID=240176 RepID=A8NE26_COPC7|nr:hypothetical protein CC1G_12297 [Coprinopsis cinerea okayama7\|eukprot:XP_001832928.1 hypothetical protein CC1G_12297 [Coprinopsis cinerea okayama7\
MSQLIDPSQISSDSSLSGALGFVTPGTPLCIRVPQAIFTLKGAHQAKSQASDPLPHVATVSRGLPFKCLNMYGEFPPEMIENPDDPAIEDIDRAGNGVVHLHILWPGYEGRTSSLTCKQADGKSVTRLEFINRVTMAFKRFFSTVQKEGEICTEPKWRIGDDGIKFTDLRLGRIMNVASNKHWQADILVELRNLP